MHFQNQDIFVNIFGAKQQQKTQHQCIFNVLLPSGYFSGFFPVFAGLMK